MSADQWKRLAAEHALKFVKPGMKLGLGTGSTAAHFVALLGAKVKGGLNVVCVPTSEATRAQAASLGIPLSTLDQMPLLDLTVDGADELDGELRLIKGGGGALLREKIVAVASQRVVIIADHSKRVEILGRFPLPVEVVPFGLEASRLMIGEVAANLGLEGEIALRKTSAGTAFVTDNGNHIFDCSFGEIDDPEGLDESLKLIPGVVESGLFLGIADIGIIAGPMGVEMLSGEDADFEEEM